MNENKNYRIQSALPKNLNQISKRPNSNFQNPVIQKNINKEKIKKSRPMTTITKNSKLRINNFEKKIIKKNKVYIEPEKLQNDAFHLLNELNLIKKENSQVKNKLKKIEKENKELESFLEENNYIWDNKQNNKESNLLISLKKILKDLEEKFQKKEVEYQEIKKELKFTKMQEINYEIEELENEGTRLKKILFDLKEKNSSKNKFTPNEEKAIKQKYLIEFLNKEQEELRINYNIINNQNEITNKKIDNTKYEIKELEKTLKELNTFIESEEKKVSILKKKAMNFKKSNREKNLIEELEKNKQEKSELKNKLKLKEIEINDLEKEFWNIQNNFIKKLEEDNKTKIELRKELNEVSNTNNDNEYYNEENQNNKNELYINNKKKEYFQYIEIKNIFNILRINLIKNKIEFKEINNYLNNDDFGNIMSNNLDIINKLTIFPFEIDEQKAKNIIEYLQNELINNETKLKSYQLFYIMIKNYEILSDEEIEDEIRRIYQDFLHEKREDINSYIDIHFNENDKTILKKEFFDILDNNEVYLNENDNNLLIIYFSNENNNDIDKNKLCDYLNKN